MNLLRHPALAIAAGTVAGVAAGLGWLWRATDAAATRVLAVHAATADARRPAAPWGFWTIEIENLASELKDERARLKQQAEQLGLREARFVAERQELDKVRAEVESLRHQISGRIVEIQESESKNLRTLSQTYAGVSPRAAVAIFRDLDDDTVVKILHLMKSESVAPIFEEMSRQAATDPPLAKRAAQLSEKLRVASAAHAPGS